MIAENKQEFFEQLERELQRLGVDDSSELIYDLEEHFAEGARRGISEEEICRELGNIAEIARSCLDIKSSAINSMVARDVSRKRVSLTKPGRSVPADSSLSPNAINSDLKAEEDCVRSYTPEHIAEEVVPSADSGTASTPNANATGSVPEGMSTANSAPEGTNAASSAPEGTSSANSANQNTANTANAGNTSSANGTFEKIGKTVDEVCDKAGKAINEAFTKAESAIGKAGEKVNEKVGAFRPSDSYRTNVNKGKHADIPPQSAKVKTKGKSVFVDISGLQPNVNGARLAGEIVLDLFLWIWLIPTVLAIVIAFFCGAVALVGVAIMCILANVDFWEFKLVTRILFALGFLCLAGVSANLGGLLKNPAVALVKYVISRHIKAIYDI